MPEYSEELDMEVREQFDKCVVRSNIGSGKPVIHLAGMLGPFCMANCFGKDDNGRITDTGRMRYKPLDIFPPGYRDYCSMCLVKFRGSEIGGDRRSSEWEEKMEAKA